MTGRLVRKLDDVLAQVRLHHFHAGRQQGLVEGNLLAHHGLALGDRASPALAADAGNDTAGLLGECTDHPAR